MATVISLDEKRVHRDACKAISEIMRGICDLTIDGWPHVRRDGVLVQAGHRYESDWCYEPQLTPDSKRPWSLRCMACGHRAWRTSHPDEPQRRGTI